MAKLQTLRPGTKIQVKSIQLEITDIQLVIRERLLGDRWKAILTVVRTDLDTGGTETLSMSLDELLYYLEQD